MKHLGMGGKSGALYRDLSKPFDSLQHDLLLPKLNAYRLITSQLNLFHLFYLKGDIELKDSLKDSK